MRRNFENCLALTLVHEGGYVNHPKDPGGATNKGITQRTFNAFRAKEGLAHKNVRIILNIEVEKIYKTQYWDKVKGDDMPHGLDYVTFDASVNSGVGRGPKWTQKALGVTADGKIGAQTLEAARKVQDAGEDAMVRVIKKAAAFRMGFLRGLRHWKTFGRGWSRRVSEVEAGAIGMVAGTHVLRAEAKKSKKAGTGEATGAVTTIGGSSGLTTITQDIPPEALYIGAAVIAFFVIILIKRAVSHYDRASALNKIAEQLDRLETED